MILLDVKTESIAQVADQIRVDCSLSGEVDSLEIDLGSGFLEFYNSETSEDTEKYYDLYFDTEGVKSVTVRATKGAETREITRAIEVLTEEDDRLFSSDEDLLDHEEYIHTLLRPGKKTFKNIHRLAQKEILRDLNERYPCDANTKLEYPLTDKCIEITKSSLVEIDQVRAWSKYLTLHYIFNSNIRSVDDIHLEKSQTYKALAEVAQRNVPIKIDTDGDGKEDVITNFRSVGLRL